MVTAPSPPPPPCSVGYGNSPPARKLAGLPLIAITFGSARICNRFLVCSALMVAPRLRSGRNRKIFNASLRVSVVVVPALLVVGETLGGEYAPVVTLPMVLVAPVLKRLRPRAVATERS